MVSVDWFERRNSRGHSLGGPPPHFHDFYLQESYHMRKMKIWEKCPRILGQQKEKIPFWNAPRMLPMGNNFINLIRTLSMWGRAISQLQPLYPCFLSGEERKDKKRCWRSQLRDLSPLKDRDLITRLQSTSPPLPLTIKPTGLQHNINRLELKERQDRLCLNS